LTAATCPTFDGTFSQVPKTSCSAWPAWTAARQVGELVGQTWVAGRLDSADTQLGVWPGLAERPDVRYVVRDWHAKLHLVAAGCSTN
jgi:hypothetical protein